MNGTKQTEADRRGRPVFVMLLIPLMILFLLEAVLLISAIHFSGIDRQLRENADQMLAQQVENRQGYLRGSMISNWSDVSYLAKEIDEEVVAMLRSSGLDLSNPEELGGSTLLKHIAPSLVSAVHAKRVSGMFVMLNTGELPEEGSVEAQSMRCMGMCVRDMDPAAPQSDRNRDLLLERAPLSVVQSLDIATASNWKPMYEYAADHCQDFFAPTYNAMRRDKGLTPVSCGYWTEPYTLAGSQMTCIAYTYPLTLPNGTVYGILGVELQLSYLADQLPAGELGNQEQGGYLLAISRDGVVEPVLTVGASPDFDTVEMESPDEDWAALRGGTETWVAAAEHLNLYGTNTPFSGQHWILLGLVPEETLHAFSRSVTTLLWVIVFFSILVGVVGSFLISRMIANPIRRLAERVETAQQEQEGSVPDLPVTDIREIDQFSGAIVHLSRSVMEASTRFLRIIDMASVELGGFELHRDEETAYITRNFFPMLGLNDVNISGMTAERFRELLTTLNPMIIPQPRQDDSRLYQVPAERGAFRYVRVQITKDEDRTVGVAEDVTAATLERLRIEQERDYDLLTGLYNRRAIYRMLEGLFRQPDSLGCAALVMIDLDNLKKFNDNYGHDMGDQYIRQAGQCFVNSVPSSTLCARLSGDEFYLFFHGYPDQDAIRPHIQALCEAIQATKVNLPDGKEVSMSASCGVAWYPMDTTSSSTLMRYADFAMYQVKRTHKNGVAEFCHELYERENQNSLRRQELSAMMEKSQVSYHFQPIVDLHTGAIRAYEALMRVDLPMLKNPWQVIDTARREQRLGDVERMTWFEATAAFEALSEKLPEDTLLFLNSFSSLKLNDEDIQRYHKRFARLQPRIVVEIMETGRLDMEAVRSKREMPGFSGLLALDGYTGEVDLLELGPSYVKVEMQVIRGIHTDTNKQQIVAGLVNRAHKLGTQVIAEGVETAEELRTLMGLDVDLAQGYFLSRPAAVPEPVSAEAIGVISGGLQGK